MTDEAPPDRPEDVAREDIDAETVVEDDRPYFGGEDPSEPGGDADAPPPG